MLIKAGIEHCERIHSMQVAGFRALLDKYQDVETNPGAESLERVRKRFESSSTDHYFIVADGETVGYIRIQRRGETGDDSCRLSQMFILPEYQDRGYAQQAIQAAEGLYPQAKHWTLDTIKQEPKLRHLYEKMGYRLTGEEKPIKDGMNLVFYAK